MKKLPLFLLIIASTNIIAQKFEPNWQSLNTRGIPSWFKDAKFGIFIHWGVYAVPSYAPMIEQ
jgi:alpha-L-fucosidase